MRSLRRLRSGGAGWRHALRKWFLPEQDPPLALSDRELEALAAQHTEISHTVRNILHVLAGVCLFCVIALGSPDANLVASPTITIPILNYPVSFTAFLIVGPVLIAGLTLYLHVFYASLLRFAEQLRPPAPTDPERRPPHVPKAAAVFNVENWAGEALTWFLFYWAPPLVLAVFAYRAMPLRIVGPVCFSMAALLALLMIALQIHRCRPQWRRWALPPLVAAWIATAVMLVSTIAMGRVVVERRLNLVKADLSGKDLRDLDLRGAMLREAKLTGADLRRALLRDADLRSAVLQKTILTGVDLKDANLQGADFSESKIVRSLVEPAKNWILATYDANQVTELGLTPEIARSGQSKTLRSSDLPSLKLPAVDLRDADLSGFDLRGVVFGNANLSGVRLDDAQLQGADLTNAVGLSLDQLIPSRCWFLARLDARRLGVPGYDPGRVSKGDLKGLNLRGMNLRGADLVGFDLRDADLSGADLQEAVFSKDAAASGAALEGKASPQASQAGDPFRANLQGTILKGAQFDQGAVQNASNWVLAHFDKEIAVKLGLGEDHADRLKKRDLSGLPLSNANFASVDLSEWNLRGAILKTANLAGVKLNGASLQNANLYRAHLANASVEGADLTDAILECDQLRQMTGWETTRRSADLLCSRKAEATVAATPKPPPQTGAAALPDRLKPHLNLVLLGQAGAGKTMLASAITKVLASADPKIKARDYETLLKAPPVGSRPGLRPATVYVEFSTATRHYAMADAPTHRDVMIAMTAGAVQPDAGVLVLSAVDGVSSETREQIRLARLSGLSHIVVFLNKMDQLKEPRQADQVEGEVRKLLSNPDFKPAAKAVVRGSALGASKLEPRWVTGINELMTALDTQVPLPPRPMDLPFLMAVEDVFSIAGRGTVITGRVERGRIRVREAVDLIGFKSRSGINVSGVEMFRKLLDEAMAGDNVGLLLESVTRQEVERGQVVAAAGTTTIRAAKRFRGEVYFLTREEGGRQSPVFTGYRPQFYFRTTDVTGTGRFEGMGVVQPGGFASIEVELVVEIALEKGTRFAIREGGRTVGVGFVTQVIP